MQTDSDMHDVEAEQTVHGPRDTATPTKTAGTDLGGADDIGRIGGGLSGGTSTSEPGLTVAGSGIGSGGTGGSEPTDTSGGMGTDDIGAGLRAGAGVGITSGTLPGAGRLGADADIAGIGGSGVGGTGTRGGSHSGAVSGGTGDIGGLGGSNAGSTGGGAGTADVGGVGGGIGTSDEGELGADTTGQGIGPGGDR